MNQKTPNGGDLGRQEEIRHTVGWIVTLIVLVVLGLAVYALFFANKTPKATVRESAFALSRVPAVRYEVSTFVDMDYGSEDLKWLSRLEGLHNPLLVGHVEVEENGHERHHAVATIPGEETRDLTKIEFFKNDDVWYRVEESGFPEEWALYEPEFEGFTDAQFDELTVARSVASTLHEQDYKFAAVWRALLEDGATRFDRGREDAFAGETMDTYSFDLEDEWVSEWIVPVAKDWGIDEVAIIQLFSDLEGDVWVDEDELPRQIVLHSPESDGDARFIFTVVFSYPNGTEMPNPDGGEIKGENGGAPGSGNSSGSSGPGGAWQNGYVFPDMSNAVPESSYFGKVLGLKDGKGESLAESDEDEDGLIYANEERYGTDPLNPDTDGDGYPDGLEVENGYNPRGPGELVN